MSKKDKTTSEMDSKKFIEEKLLTPKQTATMVGMSVAWCYYRRKTGAGIPFVIIGRNVRYKLTEVLKWIDTQPIHHNTSKLGGDNA